MKRRIKKPSQAERERHQREQALFGKLYEGDVGSLCCPGCGWDKLEFSYTYVEPDQYAMWYACTRCKSHGHLKLTGRPPGFDQSLVLDKYQERAEKAARQIEAWWQTASRLTEEEE